MPSLGRSLWDGSDPPLGHSTVQLQIEDLTRKLRTGDLGIPPNPEDRSPSPEPIYNSEGKRLNTREFRTRKKLEEERHNLITEMVALNPDFKPPADYKPPATRVSDKVMIPQDEYPEINFVGLLIGPRGNTLKNIEKECNAKIMIRGKGSVKEGKVGRKDGQMLPGEDEPLHALVTANTMENVKKAVEQIRNILKQGIETPEDQNDLRKMQLRELARLNGTLREDDNRILRPWQSSETRSITNTTVCTKCGGAGHIASDCKFQRPGDPQSAQDKARMDKEYLSLMAELGEAPVPASVGSTSGPASTPLASAPRPAAPANNPPPPSLMSTTQSRPPWMNSGPSESRPYHGMHGGGPGGPGGGPHSFPHPLPSLTGGHGGHPMQHNPNGPPPPWMQPPPPPMNQGPHPPGHHGPPPMDQYLGSTPVGSGVYRLHQGKGMMPPPPMGMMPPPPPPPSGQPPPPPTGPLPPWQQQQQQPPPPPPPSSSMASSTPLPWQQSEWHILGLWGWVGWGVGLRGMREPQSSHRQASTLGGASLGFSWRPVASSVFFVFFLSSPKSLCLSPNRAARIPPRSGDGPSHESEDFPRPLVTLPGRQPQQRPWWTGWFGKAA
ncbi:Splicing factor 1 [Myotis davidii]|uniref:Splicing factor 1 n=1 Tax=Myotis davidii TaxID=225400 RepID=L5LEB8_MYODS|nr:Splicing factor 1 [Myotis davidii]